MTARQLITLTALIAAPIALVSLGDKPKANANAQPVQVVESPAAAAPACVCDEAAVMALEARVAALENDIAILLEAKQAFPDPPRVQQQPAARPQAVYVQRPAATGNCVGGNCSTSRGRVFGGVFGRRR